MAASAVPRLTELLEPVVAGTGHDLEGLDVTPAGRRRVVRVVVDRDGGPTLDDIADVSRAVSEALDDLDAREPDLLGGAYVLEVSSPGVDRPLTAPRHWRRGVGRRVQVHLADGAVTTGRLTEADERSVVVDGRRLDLADVARGQVQVEFARPGGDRADEHDEHDEHDGGNGTEEDA